MDIDIFSIVNAPWFSVLIPSGCFAIFIWWLMYRALRVFHETPRRIALMAGILLSAWLFTVVVISKMNLFAVNPLLLPNIAVGLLVLFECLRRFYYSALLEKMLPFLSPVWMIAIQTYRVVGIGFFTYYAAGTLPGIFVMPSGIGDIVIGATAPIAALMYYYKAPFARSLAIFWNVAGIADLIIALSVGALVFPRPIQFLTMPVSTEPLSQFPLAIITLFAVPLAIMLHLVCLKALRVESLQK